MNSRAAVSTSRTASASAISEIDRAIACDPELARIVNQSFEDPKADYDNLDWLRFITFARSLFYLYEDSYIQSLSGTTDPEAADIHVAACIALIEFPAWRKFGRSNQEAIYFGEPLSMPSIRVALQRG